MAGRAEILRRLIQVLLAVAAVAGVVEARWSLVMVSLATLVLSFLPVYFARWMGIQLPKSFLAAIAVFVFATIFLGEVFDFYNRYWWWDIALHFGSAVTFGLFGFLFIFMLFEGDRYAAPPLAIAFLSFCVAITVGVVWEIFEFFMDRAFGMNMQKSGLVDTMFDLVVDTLGAALGALTGYLYLKGQQFGGLGKALAEFVQLNRRIYQKLQGRPKG